MRKALLLSLVLLAGLFVGADHLLRSIAQDRVGAELQSSLDLANRPAVDLGGFPFTVRLIAGSFPSVSVSATSSGPARSGSVELSDVEVALEDVSFSAGDLFGGKGSIRAARGHGAATLSQRELNAALASEGPVRANLRRGRVLLHVEGIPVSIAAGVTISGGRLVVRPEAAGGGLPTLSIDLPQVVPGITYTSVEVGDGQATLSFTVADAVFKV